MRLIHLVVRTNVKQHNNFATTGGTPFNGKHNPTTVSTATGTQAFKRLAQLVRTQWCRKKVLLHLHQGILNAFLQPCIAPNELAKGPLERWR